jgi:hypothetical protein
MDLGTAVLIMRSNMVKAFLPPQMGWLNLLAKLSTGKF